MHSILLCNDIFNTGKLCCDFKVYNLKPKPEYEKKVYAQLNLCIFKIKILFIYN
jgi:hypothetical protein